MLRTDNLSDMFIYNVTSQETTSLYCYLRKRVLNFAVLYLVDLFLSKMHTPTLLDCLSQFQF